MDEMQARKLIREERNRQITSEGWTREHDDLDHDDGSLAWAGTCYLLNAMGRCVIGSNGAPLGWPWDIKSWKPKDPVRDLVRAGALYTAEKERLHRLPGSHELKYMRSGRMNPRIDNVIRLLKAYSLG